MNSLMAERELSTMLKNLKFMRRSDHKQEKRKIEEEEAVPAGDFLASFAVRRCVVIVEGDPRPGAPRGRMSFLGFNPSIEKLNQDSVTSYRRKNESLRKIGSSAKCASGNTDDASNDLNVNQKRKQHKGGAEAETPNKSRKNEQDNQVSKSARLRRSRKQNKHEKLDSDVPRSTDS